MSQPDASSGERQRPAEESYEAPRVETSLSPEELEREVHYAGSPTLIG